MNSSHRLSFLVVLSLLGSASLVSAEPRDPAVIQAQMEEQWQEIVTRLKLSDEQIAAAQPIVETHMQTRMDILSEFRDGIAPGQKPNRAQLMGLRDQMQASRAAMRTDLAPILTPEQLAELDTIQDERRAAMRDKIRNGDFSGAL